MKTIMIIEDDKNIQLKLVEEAKKVNKKIIILLADSRESAFLLANTNEVDAFFIDIQLINSSGIHLAKNLRNIKKYQFVPMVFITAVPSKELEVFRQVHCYDYILKPFTDEQISEMFQKIIGDYFSNVVVEEKLTLEFKGYSQLIKMKDILYIEYSLRKISIVTRNDVVIYKHIPLKKFLEKLPKYFIQTHQAFIVNSNYIEKINVTDSVVCLGYNDLEIPLGRSYKQKVGDALNEFS